MIALRIPSWSKKSDVRLNGGVQKGMKPGKYHKIGKYWKNTDVIELELDMGLHVWAGEERFAGKTSVYYGPLLLALDEAHTNKPIQNIVFSMDAFARMTVKKGNNKDIWLECEVQDRNGESVKLIDFASAGKQESSYYTTWLKIDGGPEPLEFNKDTAPVWVNCL